MARYRLTPLAEKDLEDIWRYSCETWSATQADRYFADIMDVIEDLAEGRRQGRELPYAEGYLSSPAGRHLVFFRPDGNCIDVIRILHQRMDALRHL